MADRTPLPPGPRSLALAACYEPPPFEAGSVWLAGAGPGDPGLLTLHAVHGLTCADVIVHDALIDPRVLQFARFGCRIEGAGKRGGKPSPRQRDISARLVALASRARRRQTA